MPKFHITRSIHINAPAEKIFNVVNDFSHWRIWSPWLVMEPEATLNIAGDNKSYSWSGNRVGSGNMTILEEKENESITYDLNFLKPWKSHSDVAFKLKEEDGGTRVTWLMDGSLPWFMFWMKKMTIGFISMDYDRGLNMLKDYVEDGKVNSQLNFKGESSFPGCTFIAIKSDSSMDDIGKDMSSDFEKLWAYMDDKKDLINGLPFSIYHKWDMVKGGVSYTSGVPVSKVPDDLPDGMISGSIPTTKVHIIEHVGSYRHLGNAWTTQHTMMRSKEFKAVKSIHPFELYVNDPSEVPEDELITQVLFACK
ncbi:MAG: hypothetical protein HKN68_00180 [Saprospiraceae bacterium]|nr:hypothetical protein [Saprospiraceae bacterium]